MARLCKGVKPGKGRVHECLRKQMDQLRCAGASAWWWVACCRDWPRDLPTLPPCRRHAAIAPLLPPPMACLLLHPCTAAPSAVKTSCSWRCSSLATSGCSRRWRRPAPRSKPPSAPKWSRVRNKLHCCCAPASLPLCRAASPGCVVFLAHERWNRWLSPSRSLTHPPLAHPGRGRQGARVSLPD